jgi:hypothetical protein
MKALRSPKDVDFVVALPLFFLEWEYAVSQGYVARLEVQKVPAYGTFDR